MLFNWRLPLPSARNATAQILVAAADIAAAAAALYVLLPGDVTQGYAMFLILFVVALVIGTVSHAPGGLGVFEATVLLGLGAGNRPDVVAALVLFRVIYYFLPLAVAGSPFWASKATGRGMPSGPWRGGSALSYSGSCHRLRERQRWSGAASSCCRATFLPSPIAWGC